MGKVNLNPVTYLLEEISPCHYALMPTEPDLNARKRDADEMTTRGVKSSALEAAEEVMECDALREPAGGRRWNEPQDR